MIKLEHKVLPERGVVAFALESSSADDTAILDIFLEIINNPKKYSLSGGFVTSNRLVVHARGFTKEEFEQAQKPIEVGG